MCFTGNHCDIVKQAGVLVHEVLLPSEGGSHANLNPASLSPWQTGNVTLFSIFQYDIQIYWVKNMFVCILVIIAYSTLHIFITRLGSEVNI